MAEPVSPQASKSPSASFAPFFTLSDAQAIDKPIHNYHRETIFHLACEEGNLDFLTKNKSAIDADAKNFFGETLLHVSKDLDVLKFLISKMRPNFFALDVNENTPLHNMVRRGDLETLKFICETSPMTAKNLRNAKNVFGEDVLHYACKFGHAEIVQYLVESVFQNTQAVFAIPSNIDSTEDKPSPPRLTLNHYLNLGPNPVTQYLQLYPQRTFQRNDDLQLSETIFQFIVEPYDKGIMYSAECDPSKVEETELHKVLYDLSDEDMFIKVSIALKRIPKAQRPTVLNTVNKFGETALHIAMKSNPKLKQLDQIVDLLVRNGANLNIANRFGCTPLYYALRNYGNEDITTIQLYKHGAVVGSMRKDMSWHTKSSDKNTFINYLHTAIEGGSVDIVAYLLQKGCRASNSTFSPLHTACFYGSLPIVKQLMGQGLAIPNAVARLKQSTWATMESKFGESFKPAFIAARMGHLDVVKYLHSTYPDTINPHETQEDVSILTMACHGDENVESSRVELVKYLIENKVNDSLLGKRSLTSPMIACYYGNVEVLKLLLKEKFSVAVSTFYNKITCLHMACFNGKQNIIEELQKKHKSTLNKLMITPNAWGARPVHYATYPKSHTFLEYLHKQFQAKLWVGTNRSISTLHYACCFSNKLAVRYLLAAYVNPCSATMEGMHPLHVSALLDDIEISFMLLNGNANPNATVLSGFYEGETPTTIACAKKNNSLTTLLVSRNGATKIVQDETNSFREKGKTTNHTYVPLQLKMVDKKEASNYSYEMDKIIERMVKHKWTAGIVLYLKFLVNIVLPIALNMFFISYNFHIYAILRRVPEEASGATDTSGFIKVARVVVVYTEIIIQPLIILAAIILTILVIDFGRKNPCLCCCCCHAVFKNNKHRILVALTAVLRFGSFSVTRFVVGKQKIIDTVMKFGMFVYGVVRAAYPKVFNWIVEKRDKYSVLRDYHDYDICRFLGSMCIDCTTELLGVLIVLVIVLSLFWCLLPLVLVIGIVTLIVLTIPTLFTLFLYLLGTVAILIKMKQMTYVYTDFFPWRVTKLEDVLFYLNFIAFVSQIMSVVNVQRSIQQKLDYMIGHDKEELIRIIQEKLWKHRYRLHVVMILATLDMNSEVDLVMTCVQRRYHFLMKKLEDEQVMDPDYLEKAKTMKRQETMKKKKIEAVADDIEDVVEEQEGPHDDEADVQREIPAAIATAAQGQDKELREVVVDISSPQTAVEQTPIEQTSESLLEAEEKIKVD